MPGVGDAGGLRKPFQAAIEHGFHAVIVRQKGVENIFTLDDDDPRGAVRGVERKSLLRPRPDEPAGQSKKKE